MAEQDDNLVFNLLRGIRADVGTIRDDLRDLNARMSSFESHQATFHHEVARHSSKFDDLDLRIERIERIERRLELND